MYDQLRRARKAKGATCADMARKLGLKSKASYQKKEAGQIPLKLEEARVLAEALGKPMETLFFARKVSQQDTKEEHT